MVWHSGESHFWPLLPWRQHLEGNSCSPKQFPDCRNLPWRITNVNMVKMTVLIELSKRMCSVLCLQRNKFKRLKIAWIYYIIGKPWELLVAILISNNEVINLTWTAGIFPFLSLYLGAIKKKFCITAASNVHKLFTSGKSRVLLTIPGIKHINNEVINEW